VSPTSRAVEVQVGDRTLRLTNLDKVYWPELGFTKGQMIDYYTRIAPAILPHLRDRPLTLKRYPEGIDGEMFYEKNCPKHRPPWVRTAKVWSEGNDRDMYYCMAQDLPTLVWVAQLGTIELHTSLSRYQDLPQPTCMVFDLDPGPPANIVQCCQVAIWLREWFTAQKLQACCKTSGSKGLQLYVPINTPVDYDRTKLISKGLAQKLERERPREVVHMQRKTLREGRVLIDWSQNDEYKTTVNVYSVRARARPTVSTPVSWEEVEHCLDAGDPDLLVFDSEHVLDRFEKLGDLFEPVLKLKQRLPDTVS
jgi:bifunctional non-homologous end joining protein LigD